MELTQHFNLLDFEIKVVNLTPETIERVRKMCTCKEDWKSKELLQRAGLSDYDIARLGVRRLHRVKVSGYRFRQFLKKRERYDTEKFDSQHRKLKEQRKKKRTEEKQRLEVASIRRALLRINARYLNQSRLWNQQ